MYAFFALILFTLATLSGGMSLLMFQHIGQLQRLLGPFAQTVDGETEMLLCLILCAVSLTGGALVVGMQQLLAQLQTLPAVPYEESTTLEMPAPRMVRRWQAVPQMPGESAPLS